MKNSLSHITYLASPFSIFFDRSLCPNWLLNAACAVFLLLVTACSEPAVDEAVTIIENVTVIDAVSGSQSGMDVVLSADKVISVSTHSDKTSSQYNGEIAKIDGEGKFLIPGLWDAHVHLTYTPGLDHNTFFPLSLAYGVTSLRDTGGHLDQLTEARALAESDALTPDLYVSGPLIDGALRVYDGRSASYPDLSVGAETPEDAARIVDEMAAAGVDLIKAYEMLPEDVFMALVAQAKIHGLPVAAHVPLSMTAADAARSGASDFQHLRNLEFSCADNSSDLHSERLRLIDENAAPHAGALRSKIHKVQRTQAVDRQDDQACDQLIALLAENKVFQTPTLTISRFFTRRLYADESWRETFDLVPAKIGDGWRERSSKLLDYMPDEDAIDFDVWLQAMVKRLSNSGVRIIAGTDAPIGFLTPGASLHEELVMLVQSGLSPLQAIEAATLAPAAFFGLEDEMGTIKPGMTADLVLLTDDPLLDIKNTSAIDTVFKDGRAIDRQMLDALLLKPSSL